MTDERTIGDLAAELHVRLHRYVTERHGELAPLERAILAAATAAIAVLAELFDHGEVN
jgi:hypothetical protein